MILKHYAGVDVGASGTKVVIIDSLGAIKGFHVGRSGTDFTNAAEAGFKEALAMGRLTEKEVATVISTGYGRDNVPFAPRARTEISCHGKGCFHYFPKDLTIIDIGGQDNKIIKLDKSGRRTGFKMNRKCAAGTGAFLEEMAARLNVPLSEMNELAMAAEDPVKLGSFCTVFSATEILEHIRKGRSLPDIVKGVFVSMIKRVLEMDFFSGSVVMTGGVVAYNRYMVEMASQMLNLSILVPDYPQLTGALGAALYACDFEL